MIRTLKAIAVLGTAYIALLACPSGAKGVIVGSASPSASVAAVSPTESATPLPSATESASASPSESATASASASAEATATEAPTTAPSEAPTAAATVAATTAPTQAPTATPAPTTPAPTPSPTPFVAYPGYLFVANATGPVPAGFTRYGASVVDASTGTPVVGACVYTGPPAGCLPKGSNQTDANGYWAVDLPSGTSWSFTIEHPLYHALVQLKIAGTGETLKMTHN